MAARTACQRRLSSAVEIGVLMRSLSAVMDGSFLEMRRIKYVRPERVNRGTAQPNIRRHCPRKRAIQYTRSLVTGIASTPRRHGVLDRPLSVQSGDMADTCSETSLTV